MTSQISPTDQPLPQQPCAVLHKVMQQEGIKTKSKETTVKAEPPHQRMVTYPLALKTLLGAEIPTAGRGKLGEMGFNDQAR